MNRIVLLLPHKDYFYNQYLKHVNTYYIFKDFKSKFILGLKRLSFLLFPSCCSIWFTNSFKNIRLDKYDKIILFDSYYSPYIANYLKNRYPTKQVILFYRNHIDNPSSLTIINSAVQVWSYDIEDCKKYDLKHNTQFYFSSIKQTNIDDNLAYDFFFIGQIKGRKLIIDEVYNVLKKIGFKVYFYVIDNTKKDVGANKYIDYSDVVDLMSNSRCIVDLVGSWQKGLTLRPLEALFFSKKLLTNFEEIKDYDFYSPNNIFIYGKDSISDLSNFLSIPIDAEMQKYIDKYNFPNWINRFN